MAHEIAKTSRFLVHEIVAVFGKAAEPEMGLYRMHEGSKAKRVAEIRANRKGWDWFFQIQREVFSRLAEWMVVSRQAGVISMGVLRKGGSSHLNSSGSARLCFRFVLGRRRGLR